MGPVAAGWEVQGPEVEQPDFRAMEISAVVGWLFYIGISAPWVLKNEKSVADHIFSNQVHLFEDLNCRNNSCDYLNEYESASSSSVYG